MSGLNRGVRQFFTLANAAFTSLISLVFTVLQPTGTIGTEDRFSIDLVTDEAARNTTNSTVGIADTWSIAVWIKSRGTTTTNFHGYLELRNSINANDSIDLLLLDTIDTVSQYRIRIRDTAGTIIKNWTFGIYNAATWTHLVVTWDGSTDTITVYEDATDVGGSATKTTDGTGTMGTNGRQIRLGTSQAETTYMDGLIHSAAIWDVDLAGAEVTAIYNSGDGAAFDLGSDSGSYASSADLLHWWRFNDPGDIGNDSAGALDLSNPLNLTAADLVNDYPGI